MTVSNVASTVDAPAEFYTLLVNGQQPKPTSLASFVHNDINCHPCPYGGRCLNGISAVPNFWGYVTGAGDSVRFQGCPRGYCCATAGDCHGIDVCRRDRVGDLCGECQPGFSEAIFTAECVPNVDCNPSIGWPVMLCSGILCFVFLLFQRDIRELMFSRFGSLTIAADKQAKSTSAHAPEHCLEDTAALPGRSETRGVDPSPLLDAHDKADQPGSVEFKFQEDIHPEITDTEEREPLRQQEVLQTPPSASSSSSPPPDKGVSFLIIIFFYFQDAQLLHIKTVFASSEQHAVTIFREFLAGLFRFQVEIFQFMGHFCFLADLTPVKKMVVNVAFVPYILLQFGIVHILHRWSLLHILTLLLVKFVIVLYKISLATETTMHSVYIQTHTDLQCQGHLKIIKITRYAAVPNV